MGGEGHYHCKLIREFMMVMLIYAGEYCDVCQLAGTVIRSSDGTVKSCIEG